MSRAKLVGVCIVSFLLICSLLSWLWQRANDAEGRYQRAIIIQQDQMKQSEQLSKALHISEMNSKELQAAYEALRHRPPAASFTQKAPTIEVAAEQVAGRINTQDASLPSAALEKTERTAVVPIDREYKVAVLKINLDKAWELSTGVGWHQGDVYLPVGVQRNYAAHKAIAVEVHLMPGELARKNIKTSGWEVRHAWRF